jgi:hypothetical protein
MCYVTSCLEHRLYSRREFITACEFLGLRDVISERRQITSTNSSMQGSNSQSSQIP